MNRTLITDALIAELKRVGIDRCLLCDDRRFILICPQCRRRPDHWDALKPLLAEIERSSKAQRFDPALSSEANNVPV
jgi:hypothetical protein